MLVRSLGKIRGINIVEHSDLDCVADVRAESWARVIDPRFGHQLRWIDLSALITLVSAQLVRSTGCGWRRGRGIDVEVGDKAIFRVQPQHSVQNTIAAAGNYSGV